MGHKDAHVHAELLHGGGELILEGVVAAHHAVVFPGGEALVAGELELVEGVASGEVVEHAEVGGVVELELFLGLGGVGHGGGSEDTGGGGGSSGFEEVASGEVHLELSLACFDDFFGEMQWWGCI